MITFEHKGQIPKNYTGWCFVKNVCETAHYIDGVLHYEKGPALRTPKTKQWFFNGKLHRLDGPSVVDYGYVKRYFLYGKEYTDKDYHENLVVLSTRKLQLITDNDYF